jgi:glucose-6-phosphate isomerase
MLRDHADDIKHLHLRDLLSDGERCRALRAEYDGILLDYSRQNVNSSTMVKIL